jgi:predicted amidohydrolase
LLAKAGFMKVRVSLVQFARESEEKERNIQRMTEILTSMSHTDIVCLPENWVGRIVLSEDECKTLISVLSKIASENGFNLLTGGTYVYREGRIFDSCYVIDKNGELIGFCDKFFPSKSVGERGFLSYGEIVRSFIIEGSNVGVVICVDAVYPEITRSLASKGAEIVFNPSNIPENRLEMWKNIGVTRAIENGIFFIFLNNTSTHYLDGRRITGHSFIVSPDGELVAEADEKEQIISYELDLTKVSDVRSRWSFLEDVLQSEFFKPSYRENRRISE